MTSPKTCADLLPGDKVVIAKIEMTFDYFSGPNPVFYHYADGKRIDFIDRGWTGETKLSQIR